MPKFKTSNATFWVIFKQKMRNLKHIFHRLPSHSFLPLPAPIPTMEGTDMEDTADMVDTVDMVATVMADMVVPLMLNPKPKPNPLL